MKKPGQFYQTARGSSHKMGARFCRKKVSGCNRWKPSGEPGSSRTPHVASGRRTRIGCHEKLVMLAEAGIGWMLPFVPRPPLSRSLSVTTSLLHDD
jgi:hypothetical protein